ncbi:MAG: hypothetical protein GX316_00630 [Firmicutes bacterium]|nr:hypothetical protein [Bacillota bacterium]
MRKRLVAICLAVSLLVVYAAPTWASSTPLEGLRQIELILYGQVKDGSLIERLNGLEYDVFSDQKSGPILVRIEDLKTYLMLGSGVSDSLQLKLNAIEWMMYQKVSADEVLFARLEQLENDMFGEMQPGSVIERADTLLTMVWATDKLNVDLVTVPKETLVKIKLLTELDSSKNKVGDRVRYRVIEDVIIKDRLVVPAGIEGLGRVQDVTAAKRLGMDGKLTVDFGTLTAIDGTGVSLVMSEKATEKNKSLELAAGAGMAGVILLGGPIGLAGAYFVKGKDVSIATGTEFYVEVMRDARVSGLSLMPIN